MHTILALVAGDVYGWSPRVRDEHGEITGYMPDRALPSSMLHVHGGNCHQRNAGLSTPPRGDHVTSTYNIYNASGSSVHALFCTPVTLSHTFLTNLSSGTKDSRIGCNSVHAFRCIFRRSFI